jgi:hypothetical protein
MAQERQREGIAEALRPATGMDTKQFNTLARRQRLSRAAQAECRSLDRALPRAEVAEHRAGAGSTLEAAQKNLDATRGGNLRVEQAPQRDVFDTPRPVRDWASAVATTRPPWAAARAAWPRQRPSPPGNASAQVAADKQGRGSAHASAGVRRLRRSDRERPDAPPCRVQSQSLGGLSSSVVSSVS